MIRTPEFIMVFIGPMVCSVAAVIMLVIVSESRARKVVAMGLAVAALAMQFVPALEVHFLIPLFIQLGLCGWIGLYWQLNSD
jgi:riboflavin transporter FmnP